MRSASSAWPATGAGDRLAERQVGGAAQAVEAVEMTAGVLDRLERLGELAERLDRRVVDALGSLVLGQRLVTLIATGTRARSDKRRPGAGRRIGSSSPARRSDGDDGSTVPSGSPTR